MRMLILSALLGLGLGLAGTAGATAAPLGAGLGHEAGSLVEQAQYYRRRYRPYRHYRRCSNVRVCRWTPYGRRCHWERVCRRW